MHPKKIIYAQNGENLKYADIVNVIDAKANPLKLGFLKRSTPRS